MSSEYLPGIVIGTFLASETKPQRLLQDQTTKTFIIIPLGRCRFHPLGCLHPSKSFRGKPYVRTVRSEEKHQLFYFWTNISHPKGLPKESNLSQLVLAIVTVLPVQTVMAIVTLLAIEFVMAIVTALAIETDMAIVTLLAIETDMAIVTALGIETNIHGYRDRTGHWN